MNPLLSPFDTAFETVPFDKIKNEHYLPALKEAIKEARVNNEKIKNNTEEATFENTIVALENGADLIDRVAGVFFNLTSAETNDEMQEIAKEFSPLITEFSNESNMDEGLFQKIKVVWDKKDTLGLDVEQMTLLEKMYKGFTRNGALLSDEDKETLKGIDQELSKLQLEYGDNVLKETNEYLLLVENKDDLKGLPEGCIEAAEMTAKEKGHEGKWAFTLDYPSLIPLMTYADNRSLREEIAKANAFKACKGNEYDNNENVKKISALRHKRALLLGYESHSHFTLEERMAKDPKTVFNFLGDILQHAKPVGHKEMAELKEFSKSLGGPDDFESWDYAYYAEKLKKEKYSIDDEVLKPYFKLENVIDGVFAVATKLYGLDFKELTNVPKYHKDVMTYEVTKDGKHIAVFYADFFPREGKRNGAWMTEFRGQKVVGETEQRPHVAIVCNFTKPTSSKPSLLTFNEVTTLFHEFGHALHGMMANGKYSSLSGTNVFWDFVELPSQIFENWAYEQECLDLFATHYETGEKIPAELIQKIKDSANFHEGRNTLRQLSFALLDMGWHSEDPARVQEITQFEEEMMEECNLLPKIENSNMSSAFSHIFQGGYSSAYYSYKWAEVLDADAFEAFKEKGIFNKEVATKFLDNILSKGGTEHPMELYKRFRGKEPSTDALLKRGGLL